jgi:hypothetical protein
MAIKWPLMHTAIRFGVMIVQIRLACAQAPVGEATNTIQIRGRIIDACGNPF